MRCDGRDNTKKLYGFISIVVPQKTILRSGTNVNQQKHKKNLEF